MRFRRLEVRAYRAIDHAELELGPGLNVLYGPNDLGKSTLAAALRAVLLLPAESTAHQAFVPWHDVGPPKVRLSFEQGDDVFRVTKVFGAGSLASALLESSPDGAAFREEERGRAVDRRVRELLRWGIEAPGGKGAARGLPESFLSQVLLGDQSDVPLILDRSLGTDRDASGRERLLEALQALSQDPLFKRVLSLAQAKVDSAFTPTGRRKTGQGSPFVQLKEQITLLAQEHERLTQQRRESEEVQQRILSLEEERLAIEAEIGTLEVCVDRDTELSDRLAARQRAAERVEQAEQAIHARAALRAELANLEAELAALTGRAAAEQDEIASAEAQRRAAEERAATADQMASERTGEGARARQASERARLSMALDTQREQKAALERLIALRCELDAADAAHATELEALAAAERAEAPLRAALERADAELGELRELETVLAWRAAERAAERARAALAEAERLEAQAGELREQAEQARAHTAAADLPRATLSELAQLARQIAVAAARLDVGLAVAIRAPIGSEVRVRIDGGPERVLVAGEDGVSQRARSRIQAHIAGGIELGATAGDAALRGELEELEERWRKTALPLFAEHGATDLGQLETFVEAARERQRDVVERLRAAETAEARAAEKRELGADHALHERRATELRSALGKSDLEALQKRLESWLAGDDRARATEAAHGAAAPRAASPRSTAAASVRARGAEPARQRPSASATPGPSLTPAGAAENPAPEGSGLEALLERRRVEAEARRSRTESELTGLAAARVRALTRVSSLDDARDGVRARLIEAWRAHLGTGAAAPGSAPEQLPDAPPRVPEASDLLARLGDAGKACDAAQSTLSRWERQVAHDIASAEREREQAARALSEARARYDAVQVAGRELRERQLALTAQLAERRLRADPSAESAARRELELARGELESYGALEELPPEQLARRKDELARAKAELERVLSELRRAEGALAQVGGDVVAMRERQTQEALENARARELDQEREYDAYRLLVEQLREVENEQGVHLGRALEAPVSERFERLTEGRYRQVELDAGLALQGVAVAGKARAYGELSEGTQEQLATILRLCIAEYLETALVLDDHLAQTHRQRAQWFKSTLRESAARIQIIVLTARPEDYLAPEEFCNGAPTRDMAAGRVRAIDLERVIRRAQYGRAGAG